MRYGSVLLAALLAMWVATGLLRAREERGSSLVPEEPWRLVETKNFVLLGNAPGERLRSLATDAERFRYAIDQVAPGIELETPVPSLVFAFHDPGTFDRFSRGSGVAGGFFIAGDHASYFGLNVHPDVNASRILYKEYVHHLLRINDSPAPAWLRFGLAELLSHFQVIDGVVYVGESSGIQTKVAPGDLLPISELVGLDQPVGTDPSFEFQSKALLRYLLIGNAVTHQEFDSYIRKLYGGEPPGRAFQETFREHLLDDPRVQVAAFLAQKMRPLRLFPVQELGAVELTTRSLDRAEVLSRLGSLLLAMGPERHLEARELLDRALELDPEDGTAHLGLAVLARTSEETETVLLHAEKALKHLPVDARWERARANLALGSALLDSLGRRRPGSESDRARLEQAREALRLSMELNPENPQPWTELVIAYGLETKPLPEELEVLAEAMERFPNRVDLVSNAVLAHGRRGDRVTAEALYRRLEKMGADERTLTRAREVLLRLAFYEADRLIHQERHDDAIGLFARIQSETTDPRLRQQVTDRIALLERAEEYNRFIDRLLESQERMANGDLEGAEALLEELKETARPGQQTEVVEALAERLMGLQAEPRGDGAQPR